ncbi:MAG: branched-chain amino acid ABC transporter ATP-binding protein, partial [Methanoregula sp.]
MLSISHLNVFHGNLQVVWDFSFHVNKGELVPILVPNDAVKPTTLQSIAGLNTRAKRL